MKGFIFTPHDDPDYDSCIISEKEEKQAVDFLYKLVGELWDNLEYGAKFNLEVEFRELTEEEARVIES